MKLILIGGLGNQLFQLTAALNLCNDEIEVLCNLGNPKLNTSGAPEIFDFLLPVRVKKKFVSKQLNELSQRVIGLNLRMHLGESNSRQIMLPLIRLVSGIYFSMVLREFVKVSVSGDLGYFNLGKMNRRSLVIGYFQSHRYLSKKTMTELQSLEPKMLTNVAKNWLVTNQGLKLLAIHSRIGDYLNEPTFGVLSKDYFVRAMKEIDFTTIDKVIVFTDSLNEVSNYLPLDSIGKFEFAPEGISSVETLWLMKRCDQFVISNSSFSWWAATLSTSPYKKIVAPNPWFLKRAGPNDLLPPQWIQINR